MRHQYKLLGCIAVLLTGAYFISSCVGLPEGIEPVQNFEKQRYLEKWYEIARLDHRFERGLSEVTATYSAREDGGIKVVNRGYDKAEKKWREVEGKVFFVSDASVGHLKVSFFGPFYGSYVVFELDEENYEYAYITSYNRDFLWFLSRKPVVSDDEKKKFTEKAEKLGFQIDELVFVEQGDKKSR